MSSDYSSRARLFRDAFFDALDGRDGGGDADAGNRLASLVATCRPAAAGDESAVGVLEAFDAIARREDLNAAVSEAAARFESPQRFREALFFLRYLERDADAALSLMRRRAYLSAAVAPIDGYASSALDQASLLDTTTFEALWLEPARLTGVLEAIDAWRRAYAPIYAARHAEYNRDLARVVRDVEGASWQVDALEKLNRLERLGGPLALADLGRYHTLAEAGVCPAGEDELAEAILQGPVCPHCRFVLGDVAPVEALAAALAAIEQGLSTQRARLSRRAVSRLLARPVPAQDARLEQFVRVVQDGDLVGLAQVLDDGLLAFLEDLLAEPEPRVDLIDRLARDYPEVTDDSLEAVVEAFRTLVQDELQRGGGRVVLSREDGV